MVTPMILLRRFTLFILAMAEAMEQNTIGTTTQNIILMNSVPKNSILLPKLGANAPTRQPATTAGKHTQNKTSSSSEIFS